AQRVLVSTLDGVAFAARAQGLAPPAIIVIGHIVTARERLHEAARRGAPQ
ncbi:MAG: hypothetical protein JOZ94_20460, partial [Xanthobacteraceae bacterium]|nr:hypothetical protein [Xanthobacteraceae bacterium]